MPFLDKLVRLFRGHSSTVSREAREVAQRLVCLPPDEEHDEILRAALALPVAEFDEAIASAAEEIELVADAARELADELIRLVASARVIGIKEAARARVVAMHRAIHAIDLFIREDDPVEMRWLIEEHPSLLSRRSIGIIIAASEQTPGFREAATVRAKILNEARERGIAAALNEVGTTRFKVPPLELLSRFLFTEWDEDMRALLDEHPGLLGRSFDAYLRFRVMRSSSEDAIFRIAIKWARLARCRQIGVDAALHEKWFPGIRPDELDTEAGLSEYDETNEDKLLKHFRQNSKAAEFLARWMAQLEWPNWISNPPSWFFPDSMQLEALILCYFIGNNASESVSRLGERMLGELPPDSSELCRAYLHFMIGRAILNQGLDAHEGTLRQASAHLEKALEFYTPTFPSFTPARICISPYPSSSLRGAATWMREKKRAHRYESLWLDGRASGRSVFDTRKHGGGHPKAIRRGRPG